MEQGQVGLKIKSSASGLYLGRSGNSLSGIDSDSAAEFRVEGDHVVGYSYVNSTHSTTNVQLRYSRRRFVLIDGLQAEVVLGFDDGSTTESTVVLGSDRAVNQQRWLLEEDCDLDVLKL